MWRRALVALISFGLLLSVGCSGSSEPKPSDPAQFNFIPSGFLSTYSNLTPHRNVPGAYSYLNEERPLRRYTMVMLDPVQVFLVDRDDARPQVDEIRLQALARHFESEIKDSLESSYPMVGKPGYGVLTVRAAITDAIPEEGGRIWSGDGIAGLLIEAELVDSQSGEQVAAYVDAFHKGKVFGSLFGTHGCSDSQACLEVWAKKLRGKLDTSRGLLQSNKRGQIEIN
ncbi:MAG: DUF3313 domain-containing protein [Bdellovibrionales bacterium]|nr:DUF3313 domain-containing protein [Bdellovibrionales bacterium]